MAFAVNSLIPGRSRRSGPERQNLPRRLESVPFRHLHIRHHQIVGPALDRRDRLVPVGGPLDAESLLGEHEERDLLIHHGVLGQQHRVRPRRLRHRRGHERRQGNRPHRDRPRPVQRRALLEKLGGLRRLGQSGFKPIGLRRDVAFAQRGPHHQRHRRGVAQVPDFAGQRHAIHLRHVPVPHRDVEQRPLPQPAQRLRRGRRRPRFHAPAARHLHPDPPVRRIVVHDQQTPAREMRLARAQPDARLCPAHLRHDGKMKRRTAVDFALAPHRAAHPFGRPFADHPAQPGAAKFPRGRRVHLRERPEQPRHALRRNADPRVAHGEHPHDPPVVVRFRADRAAARRRTR
jgi:hypothetical protein